MAWSSTHLSQRESEILQLIAWEYSNREIAGKLFISHETVNTHRKSILKKLEVKNTAGMVRVAFERRILSLSNAEIQMEMDISGYCR